MSNPNPPPGVDFPEEAPSEPGFMFSNKTYDFVNWVALIFLPAFGALYFGLDQIWHLPKSEQVVGSCVVLGVFLGALLKRSHSTYKNSDLRFDGVLKVGENKNRFILNDRVEKLEAKDELVFKVDTSPDDPEDD